MIAEMTNRLAAVAALSADSTGLATSVVESDSQKDFDNLVKTRFDMVGCGKLQDRVSKFNQQADETQNKLNRNPFSDTYQKPEYKKGVDRYGRPEKGSKTEMRGIKAGKILQLDEYPGLCFHC